MVRIRRLAPRLALSLLLAAGFGWLLLRGGLPIAPPGDTLAAVTGWAVPAYLVTLAAVHLLRATRWRHLLRPLSPVALPTVVGVAWLGFAAVLFLPLRLGEVARPYLMGRRSEISAWAAAGTVAAERVLDGLILSSILFVALTVNTPQTPLPDRVGELAIPVASVSRATYGALGLFAAAFLLLLLLHRKREATIALLERITRLISRRLAAKLREIAERAASGLSFLPKRSRFLPFLLESAGYWGLNALALWLLARGCGLTAIHFGHACVVMGVLGIGMLVPSGPGYFGTFQLAIYVALALFVPPEVVTREGAAFVFLAYCGQLTQHAVGGLVGSLLAGRPNKTEKLAEDGQAA